MTDPAITRWRAFTVASCGREICRPVGDGACGVRGTVRRPRGRASRRGASRSPTHPRPSVPPRTKGPRRSSPLPEMSLLARLACPWRAGDRGRVWAETRREIHIDLLGGGTTRGCCGPRRSGEAQLLESIMLQSRGARVAILRGAHPRCACDTMARPTARLVISSGIPSVGLRRCRPLPALYRRRLDLRRVPSEDGFSRCHDGGSEMALVIVANKRAHRH